MSDLSFGISPIAPQMASPAPDKNSSITLKINGLPYMFDPSVQEDASPIAKASVKSGAFVLPPIFSRRQETASVGPQHATVYHIGLDEIQNTDADGESAVEEETVEPIDEEMDEKEDSEEPSSSSDNRPGMQEKDFLSEDEFKEAVYEMMTEEALSDHRAQKMWQKARLALLENLQKKSKDRPIQIEFGAVSYFFLLFR